MELDCLTMDKSVLLVTYCLAREQTVSAPESSLLDISQEFYFAYIDTTLLFAPGSLWVSLIIFTACLTCSYTVFSQADSYNNSGRDVLVAPNSGLRTEVQRRRFTGSHRNRLKFWEICWFDTSNYLHNSSAWKCASINIFFCRIPGNVLKICLTIQWKLGTRALSWQFFTQEMIYDM